MSNILEILSIFSPKNSNIINNNFTSNIILFKFQIYCPIFVISLLNRIKNNVKNNVKDNVVILLEIKDISLPELHLKLNNSFLGQQIIYFIKDMYLLDKDKKQEIYNYLINYNGPNLIFIFDQDIANNNNLLINSLNFDIPYNIDYNTYNKYYSFFYNNYNINKIFSQKLFKLYKVIPLDLIFNIMMYQSTLSSKNNYYFVNWLPKIFTQEISTFELSHNFFAKQVKTFFELWIKYKIDYPIEFWISFWSDQIWQAIMIVIIKEDNGIIAAKRYSSKLPFSFINRNHNYYNSLYLIKAHQELYNIDFNIKNEIGYKALELWFYKFLYNKL